MSKEKDRKTNAIREMEAAHADFDTRFFESPEALSGVEVAALLEQDPDCVFKTLVTQGKSGQHFVFDDPRCLRAGFEEGSSCCRREVYRDGEISRPFGVDRIYPRRLQPVGMKKLFPTFIDETAELYDRIMFSGGRIGCQIQTPLSELQRVVPVECVDLTVV